MLIKWSVIAIHILFAWPVAAQSVNQIKDEAQLAYVLCNAQADAQTDALIETHPHLVNAGLWRNLSDRAAAAYYSQPPEKSLAIYGLAIKVAYRQNNPKLLATTYYNVGRTYSSLNEFRKSIEAYETSRRLFSETGLQRDLIYIAADLGALYYIVENFQKAKEYSVESLTLAEKVRSADIPPGAWPDDYGRARALQTMAEISLRDGEHALAIQQLQSSLALYQQLKGMGSSYDVYIAGAYAALGKVYPEAGDYARGLHYLNKALDIVRTQPTPDVMASLLNSIGYLYMEQEDYAQAKANFDQSLKIYAGRSNQKEAARVMLNLGVIEQRQDNYDEALRLFKLSLQTAKATESIDVVIAAGEGIGVVLTAEKDFPAALQALDTSLALAKEVNSKTRQTELLWRSAQTYFAMGDYAQAVALAESAVDLARASHLPKLAYLATTTLGQGYAAQKKLELATQTLKHAVEQLEIMRDQVAGSEVESQLFLENKVGSYHALVDLFIKQDRPLEALLFAERAKSRVLLDILTGGESGLGKVLTQGEKEESQRLNRKISEINHLIKINETPDLSYLDSLYGQLDAARLEYQSFHDALYVAHPSLRVRSGRMTSLTDNDMNHLPLKSDAAYLEYVTSKERVYLFVLAPKGASGGPRLKVYPFAIKPEDLARKVNNFHERLANRHPGFASIARELYATLIGPAEQQLKDVKTICIVPDGFLWNLPFQALMTGSNHYFIEDHALYYSPSLSVLREMTKEKGVQERNASLIAFGNPAIGKDEQRDEELCPLPEAETEVTSIAKTFPPVGNKVLIGRAASEKTFKALAPGYSVLHLATHGVLDNRNPLYSHLLLTKSEGDVENDGLLEAREIMTIKLNADLAVLSACETGNGKIGPGEGIIGMSWAFFLAGTRSMLVSQWKVNSASTSQLMMNFYQVFESGDSGVTKASALQNAVLKTMRENRYRHPFYWAGFVLIGATNEALLTKGSQRLGR